MPLARVSAILGEARAAGVGVGAFNAVSIEHVEAIVLGAQRAALPVIIQISENTVRYHSALAPLARASLTAAESSEVPVAVHRDHATSLALVAQAVDLGLSSVMFDASVMPYAENVKATAGVVRTCHAAGVAVEAELGEVGGKDGVHTPTARTDPAAAADYVATTGIDALAVAVGSSHAMETRNAALDFELVTRLRAAVEIPLVLHGSSGVPDAGLARAVRAGITKVNLATRINDQFTAAVRAALAASSSSDPRRYLKPAREAAADEVAVLLRLLRLAP